MFSETVDNVLSRSGRTDMLAEAQVAVRSALKKAHSQEYFAKDLRELQVSVTTEDYIWNYPRFYRTMHTVRYGPAIYPRNLQPGKIQDGETQYFYQVSNAVVFVGIGAGTELYIAYNVTNPKFQYYTENARPAKYDEVAETWSYLDNGSYVDSLATPELEEAAREKVTNWLLDEYQDMIEEGALATIFKLRGDDRSRTHFSNFNSWLKDLEALESTIYKGS